MLISVHFITYLTTFSDAFQNIPKTVQALKPKETRIGDTEHSAMRACLCSTDKYLLKDNFKRIIVCDGV